ncbi:MAG: UrcA family protein [Sphingopyxis terrae]|nr:UrcA family protein [Sphingopyxis terrae]
MRAFVTALTAALLIAAGAQTSAEAQDRDYRIVIGDLSLSNPADAAAFDARVRRESRRACPGGTPVEQGVCRDRFRAEAVARLPAPARQAYAEARGERPVIMARAADVAGMV